MKKMRSFGVILALVLVFTSVFAGVISADGNEYTVQKGDVLWKIAEEHGTTWETLAEYNNIKKPDLIFPGQKLEIPSEDSKDDITITVLGTSDIHGAVNSWAYESNTDYGDIGLVRIASIVNSVKSENPNTLLIDNGDTLQGSILTDDLYNSDLTKPNPMIDMMNFIGYDAMVLGNHEFNFGLDLINKAVEEANFPILSANTYNKADDSHFVKPYIIKEVDGVKVGILGLTVPSIPRWDGPKVESLTFKHMGQEAKKYAEELKEKGADIIVASVHAGLDTRHEEDGSDAAKLVAEYAPQIDIMLVGHDHITVNEVINGVLVGAPSAANGQANEVVKFDIQLEKDGDEWKVASKEANILTIADYEASSEAEEHAKPYHEATLKFLENTIGVATADFHPQSEVPGIPEAQIRDTAVIDIINKVQLEATGADVAAAALFKNTSNLPKGDLNFANVFDIYKYANKLVAVEVTGKELKDYMEWSAAYFNTYKPGDITVSFNPDIRGYNYDMFAGIDYKIDISKPAGERIVDLTMDGEPVTDDQIIKLAINDYRYSGLTSMGIISGEAYFNSDPITLRSYIRDYIEEKGSISPEVDNNWELTGIDLNHPLRDEIIQMVKDGKIDIPTSEDGRTPNVKALNVYELMENETLGGYKTLTIAHTNDMHGFFIEGDYDGMGASKMTTKIKELRESSNNFLLLDAGDATQGNNLVTLSEGENAIKIMNEIGYDAMVAGNHEFDYGKDRLKELEEMADFPILGANVVKEDGTDFLNNNHIFEMDGIKVGVFGLATPETTYKSHPKNTEGLIFKDIVETAKENVEELKGKVDVIIALSHLGLEGDLTSEKVAQGVDGIDLIIDGHSHTTLEEGKLVNDALIVQTGEHTMNLGIIQLAIKDGDVVEKRASLFTKEDANYTEENPEIKAIIEEVQAKNEAIEAEVVATSPMVLNGERADVRTGETNLGNLITEAMLDISGADVALTNGGGIRATIDAGEVTKGDVLTVLPFGNFVQMIEVTGADIEAAIENGITGYPEASGGFPHIAGMTVTFDSSKEAGNRVVEIKIGGEALDESKTYKLVTNDFTAAGGDGYTMFADKPIIGEYSALDEVLIDFIQEKGFEKAKTDGRIMPIEDSSLRILDLPFAA
ncbi:5'-nucleotidase C-terminal domain-containing protein [Sporosalibacterium faouarense]|uniref:5'-nucleotidase C-terminal domain-containing protein n=1 Tax=Sporosalibacterium faouarense TaxID=516123 RepID=UPI00192C6193|nr:5'-nucleotidase C-terminal domain-containing protein [Sporosalibacterium faouarense]